jgi:ATP synthase in type III secretion protein N
MGTNFGSQLADLMPRLSNAAALTQTRPVKGKVKRVTGNLIYAVVQEARLGEICLLQDPIGDVTTEAEIVGFDDSVVILSPLGQLFGLSTETQVKPTGRFSAVAVGEALLGRVLDGFGRPLDSDAKSELPPMPLRPLLSAAPPALSRRMIEQPLSLGLRAIDGLLTCGEGQRIGIYGQAGTGKSLTLAQILRAAEVDIRVIALVGERGREVREFIERHLSEVQSTTVVVVATSDRSSVERMKAAQTAMTIAEYFREEGKRVLLVVDSVTRLARALREIGLSAGEPPTRRGFPPSVFTVLPALFERAGMSDRGSITAIFTVLVEGELLSDPIAEETRGLLDGHIVLSQKLAQSGHFPAIDVPASISRVMMDIVTPDHQSSASNIRALISKYNEIEFLLQVGEYKEGVDLIGDQAIAKKDDITSFLRQGFFDRSDMDETLTLMKKITS